MVAYIDEHREEYGVEPICAQLPIAPATYRRHKNRMPSRREQDDERLATEVARVFEENYGVYGRRKVWAQLNREGIRIGRDHTERLMKRLGISGAVRGRKVRTTTPDASAPRAPDLVERDWAGVDRPNAVWVSDFTYVATWAGIVYVAFVIDVYSRRIVGWRAATNMRTELVLDALEHALWARDDRLDGLICHSDAGSQGNTPASATPNASPPPARSPRSARSVTPSTTPSPRPPSGSTRPSSSAGAVPGATSTRSTSPPSNTSTGSTTADSMASSA
jgi:transposase InsO family protein